MKRFSRFTTKPLVSALRLGVLLALPLILSGPASIGFASGPPGQGTTIIVNSTDDILKGHDGLCTLREAITAANRDRKSWHVPGECPAGDGHDTIILPAGTYTLTRSNHGHENSSETGDLDITHSLDIIVDGPGATIDASKVRNRVFHIIGAHVTMSGLTIKNGDARNYGGGIYNQGTLTLTNVTVSGNEAWSGGGIFNRGILRLNNVTISDNKASRKGGGLLNSFGKTFFRNTIIAGNTARHFRDCAGGLHSLGFNLVQSTVGCWITPLHSNLIQVDPLLGPLQDNGGQAETHALLGGSPALDGGDPNGCLDGDDQPLRSDQRGEMRPLDGNDDSELRCDIGAFEFRRNNFSLVRAFPNQNGGTTIYGLLNGNPNAQANVEFFTNASCDPSAGQFLASAQVTTDENGYFIAEVGTSMTTGQTYVTGTATANSAPLGFSNCITLGGNDSWPLALQLNTPTDSVDQFIDKDGQSRWYKITVEPNSRLFVTLTNLPANYDLTVYKDIKAAFVDFLTLDTADELAPLTAEFAGDAFSGDAFSGDAFSGDAFSGDAFSGDAFSGDAFSGDAFSGDAFSGDAFSGDAFSGDAFSGDAFSGDAFSGDAFSAAVFGGDAFSGDAFSGDAFSAAFSSAQTRSLLGVSAFEGLASEGIFVNTWNNSGDFYIRVRGRNGISSVEAPFHLEVRLEPGTCGNVPGLSNDPILAPTRNARTVILTDESRMSLDVTPPGETKTLRQRLTDLANHSAVDGVVVNVNDDLRVRQANQVADNNMSCPYAKNLVAQGIKDIIKGYQDQPGSNLEYVVIIGGDEVIPFFRHPDPKILAPESNYAPPVRNSTPSQASLKLDFVLSQDDYGSGFDISMNNSALPVPVLGVGRLVETPLEIATVINAFLSTGDGVVRPQNSLVTGYDFLEDAANAISDQLQAGTNNDPVELIAPANLPPNSDDPRVWTASDLRTALLNPTTKLDLAFLSGHFTGNSTLAADYTTRLTAREVANASTVDFTNTIIFSAGCHAGYNIVNPHAVPGVTDEIDWPQAFAFKGATVIGGTGYQYGDTERLEYSERIYVEFSRQLRRNTGGPISIGHALTAAKQVYLAETPDIQGLHMKSLLQTAIFGLPMLSVDLPGRMDISGPDRMNPGLTPFTTNPGQMLGLQYADVALNPNLSENTVELTDVENPSDTVTASYLSGTDGVMSNPGEPNLPLEILNVAVDGTMLRGVGFRGGSYVDETVFPLTGAATTEVRSIHSPFQTDYFHRIQPWHLNLFDELTGGDPLLMVTPAQHMAGPVIDNLPHSIRRKFSQMNFRIYYSNDITNYSTDPNVSSIPALAGAPLISNVSALPDGNVVLFSATVAGNPAAGVQEAWIVYTVCPGGANCNGVWQPLDLHQNPADSTVWLGELDLNAAGIANPADIRYIIQAANGVGLVSRADNLGKFFVPGAETAPTIDTNLEFQSPPSSDRFGSEVTFSAKLMSDGQPLAGQVVNFRLGPVTGLALTDGNGVATTDLALLAIPDSNEDNIPEPYEVQASFVGTTQFKPAFASAGFTIEKQDTEFCHASVADECTLDVTTTTDADDTGFTATLTDITGRRLRERTVFFVVTDNHSHSFSVHDITDWLGQVSLDAVPLPPGVYDVNLYFNGTNIDLDPTNPDPHPDDIVTLTDESYNPSQTLGSLTIVSPAPIAVDDVPPEVEYQTDEDITLTIAAPGVLANDISPGEVPLTALLDGGPASGILNLATDGSFVYTPSLNFNGVVSFTYHANNGFEDSNVATTTITIKPVNDPPVAEDALASTEKNTPVDITLVASDVEDDPLTYSVTDPSNGELSGIPPNLTYTPDHNFSGTDLFTFMVNDGLLDSNVATVSITVVSTNQPPLAENDTVHIREDKPDRIKAEKLLYNDHDPDGDPLTIIQVFNSVGGTAELKEHGDVFFTPAPDLCGEAAASFEYTVSDPHESTATALVTINIECKNDAPIDILLDNDTVEKNQPKGTVVGTFSTIDPDIGDSHTYRLVDGHGSWHNRFFTIEGNVLKTDKDLDSHFVDEELYIRVKTRDSQGESFEKRFTIRVINDHQPEEEANIAPDCSEATADTLFLSPEGAFHSVSIHGITNPDGDDEDITVEITGIFQDEPVLAEADGHILGPNQAEVRAAVNPESDGRVYHLFFTATDEDGGTCTVDSSSEVKMRIGIVAEDDEGDDIELNEIDQGPLYDSSQDN